MVLEGLTSGMILQIGAFQCVMTAIHFTICYYRVRLKERGLRFSNFLPSQVGNYTCRIDNNDDFTIMIDVLSATITTHPVSQLTTVGMNVTLDCEAGNW